MSDTIKGCLFLIGIALLLFCIAWFVVEVSKQIIADAARRDQQQQAVIENYAQQGYEIPVDLLEVCIERSISHSRYSYSFRRADFVRCLDAAGFRIVQVGVEKDQ